MTYHIEVLVGKEWERIASFVNEHDRDLCLNALEEEFSDSEFRAVGTVD